jgi:hypothetical protein
MYFFPLRFARVGEVFFVPEEKNALFLKKIKFFIAIQKNSIIFASSKKGNKI